MTFTVGDIESSAGALTVNAASSNPTLIPVSSIAFGGSGTNWTFTLTPAADQFGTATITLTVSDGQVASQASFLLTVRMGNRLPTISAIANQTINEDSSTAVPGANITLGGSGADRTVTIIPAANKYGSTTITVRVDDGKDTSQVSFTVTVKAVNDAPAISNLADLETNEDTSLGPVSFTIGDVETPATSLTLIVSSTNTSLVPVTNILFGGSGANRTLSITPVANKYGVTTITVTVSDAAAYASASFVLTVTPVNDAPTISNIANQAIYEDTSTPAISFAVGDLETPVASLVMSAGSSNTILAPLSNIVFGGSGSNRTITVTPAANQTGSATITVSVSDGAGTASDTFVLTVNGVNDAPALSSISNRTTAFQTPTGPIPFTVEDVDTPITGVLVSAASSNTNLVPLSHISLAGSGSSRTIAIGPAAGQSGVVTITLIASDGDKTGSTNFRLTVSGPGDDSDGDGMPDGWELNHGLNPMLDDATEDPDDDGLDNRAEYEIGTNPHDADSDEDQQLDGEEANLDHDGDGLVDPLDGDDDGDTIPSAVECALGSPCPDSDGDTTPDFLDVDSDNDGVLDKIEGTGDTDHDGIPNYRDNDDKDSDGDGIVDVIEGSADPDGDGLPNSLDLDSDGDGLADSGEGTSDTDGDGTPDWLDMRTPLTINSISPAIINGQIATTLTITGAGFLSPIQVRIDDTVIGELGMSGAGSTGHVTLVNTRTLHLEIPPNFLPTGAYDVRLIRPDNEASVKENGLVIMEEQEVIITGVNPSEVSADTGATLMISGSGFLAGAQVKIGSHGLETSFVNAQSLRAMLPARLLLPGVYELQVVNPGGLGQASRTAALTVTRTEILKVFLPVVV